MNLLKTSLLAVVCSVSMAATAAPINLIENGSFEDPDVAVGHWAYFTSAEVDGWSGSNVEIWDHLGGEAAYEGEQFAELNAHPGDGSAFTIYQDIATTVNQSYDYSFAYQARSNASESFNVSIDAITSNPFGLPITSSDISNIETTLIDQITTTGWTLFTGSFIATTDLSRIAFTTVVPSTGTVGNFIDDVKVSASVANVPEPGSLALLGLGLAGLGLSRRRMK